MNGTIKRALVGLSMGSLALTSCLVAATPAAAGPSPVGEAVTWLQATVSAKGVIKTTAGSPDPSGTSNWGITADALVSIGLNGGDAGVLTSMAKALAKHVDSDVVDSSGSKPTDDAGKLAELSLAALVAQQKVADNPLKPARLIARLVASQRSSGLFGKTDASYDGVYRQSLALLAISVSGKVQRYQSQVNKAVSWLAKQQCDDGGFPSLKKAVGCTSDPVNYLGPDSNSTGMAMVALAGLQAASGPTDPLGKAAAWMKANENADATWGWFPTNQGDPSSTALAVAGLGSAGLDPKATTGDLARSSVAPYDAMLSFAAQGGGFAYSLGGSADLLSTTAVLFTIGALNTK